MEASMGMFIIIGISRALRKDLRFNERFFFCCWCQPEKKRERAAHKETKNGNPIFIFVCVRWRMKISDELWIILFCWGSKWSIASSNLLLTTHIHTFHVTHSQNNKKSQKFLCHTIAVAYHSLNGATFTFFLAFFFSFIADRNRNFIYQIKGK